VKTGTEGQPHVPRRGWLKRGNPPGDFTKAPRCGAKTRKGNPCPQPAMKNGRCRFHGGKSTGPRTPEGLERMRRGKTNHGFYSAEAQAFRRRTRKLMAWSRDYLTSLKKLIKEGPGGTKSTRGL
jgi:hypothetical protein